jgi:hypothetical protein
MAAAPFKAQCRAPPTERALTTAQRSATDRPCPPRWCRGYRQRGDPLFPVPAVDAERHARPRQRGEFSLHQSSNQLGQLESGVTAALFGAMPAAVLGGVATVAIALLWMKLFPTLRQVEMLE